MSIRKHKGNELLAMTANDLRSGKAVFLDKQYCWTTNYSNAVISDDTNVIEKMRLTATQDEDSNLIIAAYLIDIDSISKMPKRYRENFRISGPSYNPSVILKGENHVSL